MAGMPPLSGAGIGYPGLNTAYGGMPMGGPTFNTGQVSQYPGMPQANRFGKSKDSEASDSPQKPGFIRSVLGKIAHHQVVTTAIAGYVGNRFGGNGIKATIASLIATEALQRILPEAEPA